MFTQLFGSRKIKPNVKLVKTLKLSNYYEYLNSATL